MKIVCLYGSPRKKGNSAAVARHFLDRAVEGGGDVRSFYLNELELRGCQGCNVCKKSRETCVLQDGLTEVLGAVYEADLVVMASPVYYGDVSAQLKAFIDRTYSYLKPDYISLKNPSRLPQPKQLVFILTQGHRNPDWFADIVPRYSNLFRWTGFAETYPLRVIDVYHEGDVLNRADILSEAAELAAALVDRS